MDKEKKYALKILSGLHQGAEIPLDDGKYIIGTADECDIILNDSAMAEKHMKLVIQNSDMEIAAFEDAVFLDGAAIGENKMSLASFQIVTIGMTHISLGPVDETWPELKLPELKSIDSPVEEAKEEIEMVPVEKKPVMWLEKQNIFKTKSLFIAGGSFLLLISIIGILVLGFSSDDSGSIQSLNLQIKSIRSILEGMEQTGLQVVSQENKPIRVKGFVKTPSKRTEVVEAIRKQHPTVLIQVYSTQEVVEAVQDIFKGMGLNLNATSENIGKVVVQGYLKSAADRTRIFSIIKQDVPSLTQLENRILIPDDLPRVLSGLIKGSGIEKRIRFQAHDDHILAMGSLDKKELNQWMKLKKIFLSKYGKNIMIKENLTSSAAIVSKSRRLRLPIKGISMGGIPSVVMTDGTRYFEGGTLNNGYRIISIKADRLILSKAGRKIIYRIGE